MRLPCIFYFIIFMFAQLGTIIYLGIIYPIDQSFLTIIWFWFLAFIAVLDVGITIIEDRFSTTEE